MLENNEPPTVQERAIIQHCTPVIDAQYAAVKAQISEAEARIKLNHPAEIKLQSLYRSESRLYRISEAYLQVLAPIRNVPEDVIRLIFIACVDPKDLLSGPILSLYRPLPYTLCQISSGMRRIALTTPEIWTTINISVKRTLDCTQLNTWYYRKLAAKTRQWLDRAGSLPFSVFFTDTTPSYSGLTDAQSDPSNILFSTMLSYSPRWNRIQVESICEDALPSPFITRIAALTAVDIPLLESITLYLRCGLHKLRNSPFLSVPTLRCLQIYTDWNNNLDISNFSVNWSHLTSITIHGGKDNHVSSVYKIGKILRETKRLVFCDIALNQGSVNVIGTVYLPWLESLCVDDRYFGTKLSGSPHIFDLINTPRLTALRLSAQFLDISTPNFFKRSAGIRELSLKLRLDTEKWLAEITESLSHCPCLSALTLEPLYPDKPCGVPDANRFLRGFVGDGGAGITCPRLQKFRYEGTIKFSFETLYLFLVAKQPGTEISSTVLPWKSVFLNMRRVDNSEINRMLDFVSRKQAAGLDVHADVTLYQRLGWKQ